jgi:hypothetical protein
VLLSTSVPAGGSYAATDQRVIAALFASRRCVMATVEYKSGDYQIAPLSSQEFTFWWDSTTTPAFYFDVFIAPVFNPNVSTTQLPLVEVRRAYLFDVSEPPAKWVLLLTLRNDNDAIVYFIANHMRVY